MRGSFFFLFKHRSILNRLPRVKMLKVLAREADDQGTLVIDLYVSFQDLAKKELKI